MNNPAVRRQRQGDHKFEDILVYIVILSHKNEQTRIKIIV
jgi:hypothetical protein